MKEITDSPPRPDTQEFLRQADLQSEAFSQSLPKYFTQKE